MVRRTLFSFLLLTAIAAGQQKRFDWVAGASETFRLDPARWLAAASYGPGPIHLRMTVEATDPVAVALVRTEDRNYALQHNEALYRMPLTCPAQGLVRSSYICDLDIHPDAMTLVVHDERSAGEAIGMALATGLKAAAEELVAPNTVTLTAMRWACVENCNLPAFAWVNVFKEKFQLNEMAKSYGPLSPERDGDEVQVKLKSPVPMLVAVLPVSAADRLRAHPTEADSLLEGVACKQRAVQSTNFTCKFNLQDGTQQVVLMPEPGVTVPAKKKASLSVDTVRCVANCSMQSRH